MTTQTPTSDSIAAGLPDEASMNRMAAEFFSQIPGAAQMAAHFMPELLKPAAPDSHHSASAASATQRSEYFPHTAPLLHAAPVSSPAAAPSANTAARPSGLAQGVPFVFAAALPHAGSSNHQHAPHSQHDQQGQHAQHGEFDTSETALDQLASQAIAPVQQHGTSDDRTSVASFAMPG